MDMKQLLKNLKKVDNRFKIETLMSKRTILIYDLFYVYQDKGEIIIETAICVYNKKNRKIMSGILKAIKATEELTA